MSILFKLERAYCPEELVIKSLLIVMFGLFGLFGQIATLLFVLLII